MTMQVLLRRTGSTRLTLAGFGLLAAGVLGTLNLEAAPTGIIVAPLALLGLNLAAALAVRPGLRRGGLGVFHFALLGMLLLAGWGRLTHLDARVEVTEGGFFDPELVVISAEGPWHGEAWKGLQFRQGNWEVDYRPGVKRAHTRSLVWLPDEPAAPRVVGDDTALVLDGYRFYTTHNKGFAPLLTWTPLGGEPMQGALHLPSYPLNDFQQENSWTAPDGTSVKFWLRIERPLPTDIAWTLSPHDLPAVLVVEAAGARHELKPGDTISLPGATLRYDQLTGWMGYRIFHDPSMIPLLLVSLLGTLALGWHLWKRLGGLRPVAEGVAA